MQYHDADDAAVVVDAEYVDVDVGAVVKFTELSLLIMLTYTCTNTFHVRIHLGIYVYVPLCTKIGTWVGHEGTVATASSPGSPSQITCSKELTR